MDARNIYITKVITAFGISVLITLLLVLSATATPMPQNNLDTPYRVEEFSISSPGELEVETSGGHITVEGSETTIVRVEMHVRRNGQELSPSDTDLENFDIDISQSGNTVRAVAESQGGGGWFWNQDNNISISFVVHTPREMTTNLNTSGGHITVSGIEGSQNMRTSGGHLELADLSGTVDARTSGGHITINNFMGDLNARTSGGHIEAEHSEGTIELETSGGHISLLDIAGSLRASTSGGSIEADIRSIGQYADLRTSGGHINVSVPAGIGLNLDLRGSNVDTELVNFSGEVERDEVKGTINGGGPLVTARTSGGRVAVSFQ